MKFAQFLLLVAVCTGLRAQVAITAERLSQTPLLGPEPGWRDSGVFNAAAVRDGKRTILLFRAQDAAGTSRIGYAESPDGLHFAVRPEPVLSPEAPYEKDGGVEDPRLVRIGSLYYMTYTGYNKRDAQLCLATSRDLIHWDRKGVILPAYKGTWNKQWTKSGAIVPWKIRGKWWMYYLGTKRDADGQARDYMGLATSPDLLHWTDATDKPVLDRRPEAFDSRVMEPGPAPMLTSAGLLLLYNGANEKLVYGPGWVLFDPQDPTKVLGRSTAPFLLPKFEWEKNGQVPNVIFLEGTAPQQPKTARAVVEVTGYYGAADRFIGAVKLRIASPR